MCDVDCWESLMPEMKPEPDMETKSECDVNWEDLVMPEFTKFVVQEQDSESEDEEVDVVIDIASVPKELLKVDTTPVDEHPLYRTKFCNNIVKYGNCTRKDCGFYHTVEQARVPKCTYAENCRNRMCQFFHPDETEDSWRNRTGNILPPQCKRENPLPKPNPEVEWVEVKKQVADVRNLFVHKTVHVKPTVDFSKILYKSKPCRNISLYGVCKVKECSYYHSEEEAKAPHCIYGDNCRNRECGFYHPFETVLEWRRRTKQFIPKEFRKQQIEVVVPILKPNRPHVVTGNMWVKPPNI